jgi:putative hydrolase of the HAD superfamily
MDVSRFKALTFDIVGTLIDYRAGALACMRELARENDHTPESSKLLDAFLRAELETHREHPEMTFTDTLTLIWQSVCDERGLEYSEEDAETFKASVPFWPPFPDSVDALAMLRRSFRLVAVTNADDWAAGVMAGTLENPFDAVVTAEQVGITKPDHRPFEAMWAELDKLEVSREEVLHVAQGLGTDIEPANRLGFPVVWVDRYGESSRPGSAKAADGALMKIHELSELAERLEVEA